MNRYRYKAKSIDGKNVRGIVEARDASQAARLLRKRSLVVVSIRSDAGVGQWINKIQSRITLGDVTNFTRQLATMVGSGLPLVEVLTILERQSKKSMGEVISEIRRKVEGGASLSDALKDHPKVFSSVYIALVKAGEASGKLDVVLERLAVVLEKQSDFRGKITGALMYPAIILVGMVVVVIIMMIFVIPKLAELYTEFEVDLPITTKVLIKTSDLMTNYWWLLLGIVGVLIWTGRIMLSREVWKRRFEQLQFRTPILGKLKEQLILSSATRTLSLLIGAGVPIVESLEIVSQGIGNMIYEDDFKKAMKLVEKGFSLAQALSEGQYFPPVFSQMVAVGEETGKVDEVLDKVSIYFEKESDQRLKELTSAMEPLIMIVLGGGVGFLIFSIVMPIYNLTNAL
jgi:type II secretory pathway component PulF